MCRNKGQHRIHLLKLTLIILVAIIPFFCGDLLALTLERTRHEYLADQWDDGDNLPGNCIISITQTADGYLWLATTKGLARFDGLKFTHLDFLEDKTGNQEKVFPEVLFVDGKGTLWIGSSAGLTRYEYKTRQFKTFTAEDGLIADRIRLINEDMKGGLWISFNVNYVNRFFNGRFTAFNAAHGLEGKKINAIVEDKAGHLLFGSRENGIFIFRDETFLKYEVQGLGKDHLIITMVEDYNGDLWIGTNKGLFRKSPNNDHVDIFTTRHGLSSDYITGILEDEDRNLWVGTVNGLNRMKRNPPGSFSFKHFLGEHIITCLFKDKEDSLWIGTNDSGVRRLKKARLFSYTIKAKDQEEIIASLYENRQGDIWVGTVAGRLYHFRDSQLIETVEIPGIASIGIVAIAEDKNGELWIGTNGKGVFREKGKRFVNFTTQDGLADNLVTSIFVDSIGDLWFGTFGGVSRYSENSGESFKSPVVNGLQVKIHNVYEDKNHHILLATDKGIKVIEKGVLIENKITEYFHNIPVTCIYQDTDSPGVFWIATHGAGLKRLKNGTITSYTIARGMTSNFIYQLLEDSQENLWMMSDSGVLRAAKSELNQLAAGQVQRINCVSFGINDGMPSIEFNNSSSRHSAIKTRKGELWFATMKGIAVVNPEEFKMNKTPPPVIIEAVVSNDAPIPFYRDSKKNSFKKIEEMVFHFTAPTFLCPEKVTFKYKLEGFDRDWVFLPPGKERIASYKNLEPGTYTFTVHASNSDGVWNTTGDSISFTLKSLLHETLFFKLGVFLFLLVMAAVIYFLYNKRKKWRQKSYKHSTLNPIFAEECIKKLTRLMEVEKIYHDDSISLQSLAEELSITHHQLSQMLNEKLNKSFSDFINTYRVEEAKKLLRDPKWADRKVISIAFEVGYNTKAAFYNVFKKYTNMTPTQYRQEVTKGSENSTSH
ncbi:MAG: two-component regulator propeller domain-containing protein [Candidatus Aminicenantes bacterium]|jgi:ligand-binding sensor domain-containing protein/AraC-like DNA-binding protein